MKTVITYGTFDLLHVGHILLLKRARELGDRLIVGVSTDEFNALKHKDALMPYEHRKTLIESLRFVDLVIPEINWEQKTRDIKDHNITILTMGSDWAGKFDDLKKYCEVVYLPRTQGISTTQLKQGLFRGAA